MKLNKNLLNGIRKYQSGGGALSKEKEALLKAFLGVNKLEIGEELLSRTLPYSPKYQAAIFGSVENYNKAVEYYKVKWNNLNNAYNEVDTKEKIGYYIGKEIDSLTTGLPSDIKSELVSEKDRTAAIISLMKEVHSEVKLSKSLGIFFIDPAGSFPEKAARNINDFFYQEASDQYSLNELDYNTPHLLLGVNNNYRKYVDTREELNTMNPYSGYTNRYETSQDRELKSFLPKKSIPIVSFGSILDFTTVDPSGTVFIDGDAYERTTGQNIGYHSESYLSTLSKEGFLPPLDKIYVTETIPDHTNEEGYTNKVTKNYRGLYRDVPMSNRVPRTNPIKGDYSNKNRPTIFESFNEEFPSEYIIPKGHTQTISNNGSTHRLNFRINKNYVVDVDKMIKDGKDEDYIKKVVYNASNSILDSRGFTPQIKVKYQGKEQSTDYYLESKGESDESIQEDLKRLMSSNSKLAERIIKNGIPTNTNEKNKLISELAHYSPFFGEKVFRKYPKGIPSSSDFLKGRQQIIEKNGGAALPSIQNVYDSLDSYIRTAQRSAKINEKGGVEYTGPKSKVGIIPGLFAITPDPIPTGIQPLNGIVGNNQLESTNANQKTGVSTTQSDLSDQEGISNVLNQLKDSSPTKENVEKIDVNASDVKVGKKEVHFSRFIDRTEDGKFTFDVKGAKKAGIENPWKDLIEDFDANKDPNLDKYEGASLEEKKLESLNKFIEGFRYSGKLPSKEEQKTIYTSSTTNKTTDPANPNDTSNRPGIDDESGVTEKEGQPTITPKEGLSITENNLPEDDLSKYYPKAKVDEDVVDAKEKSIDPSEKGKSTYTSTSDTYTELDKNFDYKKQSNGGWVKIDKTTGVGESVINSEEYARIEELSKQPKSKPTTTTGNEVLSARSILDGLGQTLYAVDDEFIYKKTDKNEWYKIKKDGNGTATDIIERISTPSEITKLENQDIGQGESGMMDIPDKEEDNNTPVKNPTISVDDEVVVGSGKSTPDIKKESTVTTTGKTKDPVVTVVDKTKDPIAISTTPIITNYDDIYNYKKSEDGEWLATRKLGGEKWFSVGKDTLASTKLDVFEKEKNKWNKKSYDKTVEWEGGTADKTKYNDIYGTGVFAKKEGGSINSSFNSLFNKMKINKEQQKSLFSKGGMLKSQKTVLSNDTIALMMKCGGKLKKKFKLKKALK